MQLNSGQLATTNNKKHQHNDCRNVHDNVRPRCRRPLAHHQHSTKPIQALSCSNLDIWKEWKTLGVPLVSSSADFPKDLKNFEVQDNKVKVVLRGEQFELGELAKYTNDLMNEHTDMDFTFDVYAINVTIANQFMYGPKVHCSRCDEWALRRCQKQRDWDFVGTKRYFNLPDNLKMNVFANHFESPVTQQDVDESKNEENSECHRNDGSGNMELRGVKNGFLNMDFITSHGYTNWQNNKNIKARFGNLKSTDSNPVSSPFDASMYYMWFACARKMASWNYRSASMEQARYANQLAESIVSRLSNLDSSKQTSSLDSLLILSQSLAQSIQNEYGVWNATSATFKPANILVSKWSVSKLESKLTPITSSTLAYATKLRAGLDASANDKSRVEYLKDMSTLQSNAADANEFTLEQAMLEVTSYQASVDRLAKQTSTLSTEVDKATTTYQAAVEAKKDKDTAKGVIGFFSSIVKIAVGVFTEDIKGAVTGVKDLFGSVVELAKLAEEM